MDEETDHGTWRLPGREFFTPINVIVLVACCVPMLLTGLMLQRGPRPPGAIKPAPEFSLTDQRGQTHSTKDYRGKVWVASFLFSHCPDVCPRTLQRLRGTKAWMEEKRPGHLAQFRFVAISLDPAGDTPESAARFLKTQGHDPSQWDYLMAENSLHPLVRDGFLVGVREGSEGLAAAHSDRIALIGRSGQIRGYYDINSNEGLAQMHGHIDLLMDEEEVP
jgi:cytochrome oxidase Cu insertion factor (SCO1/SenC/PrrC family)